MYMYTKLKEALMGKGKSVSGKDWSPNSVKAIVITREFIVIAYHVKQAKLVQLDINESMQDISRNGSQGSLHNLLSQKQLSCLEEIYVDSIFQNYKGTMDLERYVNGLVNSASRLRFYGYIEPGNVYDIVNNYGKAQLNGLVDYTYAMDMERVLSVQYQSTNNDSWYTKYNLRPDKYSLDSNRGVLHTWFKKVAEEVKKAAIKTGAIRK